MFFIYCDNALVGPFTHQSAAFDHLAMLSARGDSDPGSVLDERETATLLGLPCPLPPLTTTNGIIDETRESVRIALWDPELDAETS